VALDVHLDELHPGETDRAALIELYRSLEFKSWLNDLLKDGKASAAAADASSAVASEAAEPAAQAQPVIETRYETVLEQARLDAWLDKLKAAELFAFDTETTGLDAQQAELVGISFAVSPHEAAY